MSNLAAVFQIGSLGDSVVSVPVLRSLRELLPDCSEYLLVSRYDTQMKVMPSHIFEMARKPKHRVSYQGTGSLLRRVGSVVSVLAHLRYYRPRYCVYLMPSDRTASQVHRDRLFFKAGGVRQLIGFRTLTAGEFRASEGKDGCVTEAYLRFRRVWNDKAEEKFFAHGMGPMLDPGPDARDHVAGWLSRQGWKPGQRLVAICPFSNFSSRNWPAESVVELLQRFGQHSDLQAVILGGEKDKQAAGNIVSRAGSGINACGDFSPAQSAALFQKSRLVICTESGPMHLAGALGIPTVTTFSRINGSLHRWFPLGKDHTILYREVACAGCFQTVCPIKGHPCMNDISVDAVFSAACKKLRGIEVDSGVVDGTHVVNWELSPLAPR